MATRDGSKSSRAWNERGAWDKKVRGYGLSILRLDRLMVSEGPEPNLVTEVRVKWQEHAQGLYMAILKVWRGDSRLVGFHTAPDPSEAIVGIINRYNNGTLKLREDLPWKPPSSR